MADGFGGELEGRVLEPDAGREAQSALERGRQLRHRSAHTFRPMIWQQILSNGSGFSVSLRAGRVRVAGRTRFHRALPILSCRPGVRRAGLSFVRAAAESKYIAKPSQAALNNISVQTDEAIGCRCQRRGRLDDADAGLAVAGASGVGAAESSLPSAATWMVCLYNSRPLSPV